MHCPHRPNRPGTASPRMTGGSHSVLTETSRDGHQLYVLINLRSKAEEWLAYLCCLRARYLPEVGL